MVMLDLFKNSNFKFSIAHCNFQLRENDSDLDEDFVKAYSKNNNIDFFIKKFNTQEYADKNGISIQMAARELRYKWFDDLAKNNDFNYIATAHHLDDQIETFFINLLRGTGIAGLHGILPKNNKLIRPLLFLNRKQIEEYQLSNNIKFREDKSNNSDKYLRNYIRHNILTEFYKLNESFGFTLNKTVNNLREVELVYKDKINLRMSELLDVNKEKIIINIEELKKLNPLKPYLYEFLTLYNFNETTVDNIYDSILKEQTGMQFYSTSNRVIKDRENLILVPFEDQQQPKVERFLIKSDFEEINTPIHLKFNIMESGHILKDENIAFLDFNKLEFPLEIRRWKQGDYFYPLGMKNKKKLSDFFIDEKISVYDKESAWILTSANKIVWIIGYRLDDRFKITEQTSSIFKISLLK